MKEQLWWTYLFCYEFEYANSGITGRYIHGVWVHHGVSIHTGSPLSKGSGSPAQAIAYGVQRYGIIIIESQNGLGCKGPERPPATVRDIPHQPRLLPAPSSLALSPARDGAPTAALGSLFVCLTTLTEKNSS